MERPILFNTEMVKAIMAGRKTQTRRVIPFTANDVYDQACYRGMWYETYDPQNPPKHLVEWFARSVVNALCKPGDILWVRETWYDPDPERYYVPILYKADFPIHWEADQTENGESVELKAEEYKWKPSIHMPKGYARIFLRVKDVRVEQLNDILAHAGEVAKEGIPYSDDGDVEASGLRFKELWDSTIKSSDRDKYGWKANPWVWVIEFERCEKPEGWCGA